MHELKGRVGLIGADNNSRSLPLLASKFVGLVADAVQLCCASM